MNKNDRNLLKNFYKLSNEELFKELDSESVLCKVNAIDALSIRVADEDVLNRLLNVIDDKRNKELKAIGFLSVADLTIIYLLRTKSSEIKVMIDNILQSWSETERKDLLNYLKTYHLYDEE